MCWANLPDILLEDIYRLLSFHDRFHASLVCKDWYTAFCSPLIWRELVVRPSMFTYRRFDPIKGYQTDISHFKVQMCLANIGNYLRKVVIKPNSNFYALHEVLRIFSAYLEFYEEYPMPELKSFSFTFACEIRGMAGNNILGTGGKILEELERLLGNLRGLSHLKVNQLLLDTREATGILDGVVKNCEHTLKHLEILNCTKTRYPFSYSGNFHNLSRLTISPTQLTGDVVLMIANHRCLTDLVIVQDNYTPAAETVDSKAWLEARHIKPELRVRLEIRRLTAFELLLQERAPVTEIVYKSPYSRATAEEVIQITEQYSRSLQVYCHSSLPRRFSSRSFHERGDTMLVLLVRECTNIHTLVIHERVSTATLIIIAKEAKNLKRLQVRQNAVLKRFDWPRCDNWNDEFWTSLKKCSRSYELMEAEVSRLLKQEWHMLPDKQFKKIKL